MPGDASDKSQSLKAAIDAAADKIISRLEDIFDELPARIAQAQKEASGPAVGSAQQGNEVGALRPVDRPGAVATEADIKGVIQDLKNESMARDVADIRAAVDRIANMIGSGSQMPL